MEKTELKERVVSAAEEAAEMASEQLQETIASIPSNIIIRPEPVGLLDRIQEKMVSRKLLVFIVATALMWYGLDPETWGLIAMMYIGGQSAIDMVKVWKWG